MPINQTKIFDALKHLGAQPNAAEFIFGFLEAFHFPRATITRLKRGAARNVAKAPGEVGLQGTLYFKPVAPGQSLEQTLEALRSDPLIRKNKIRFLIVTDFKDILAHDLKVDEGIDCALAEMYREYAFFLPLVGQEKIRPFSESAVDVKAAEKMGRLFDLIRERNRLESQEDIHALNVFMTRLLFCFFAEDTGIFTQGDKQFTAAIQSYTRENGADLDNFLHDLFVILNIKEDSDIRQRAPKHLSDFPYVNGKLFESEEPVPEFGARARRMLIECGAMDWSEINPDIFGSMFQAVIDEEQRSHLGQHYTSVTNIMKVIQPLFLDKLYDELETARGSVSKLKSLLDRVSNIKVFDPACGSGNFLIIAYKELRKFEMEVFHALDQASQQQVMFLSGIKLTQFHGIEIDDFAHEIALLSLWLAEHQMNVVFKTKFGQAKPTLPLESSGRIVRANSLRYNWNDACPKAPTDEVYVIGNPPFLGTTNRTSVQTEDMKLVFDGLGPLGYLDYVASWFWKGAQYLIDSYAELAFVATNSICQGEQVGTLWPNIFNLGLEIHIAHQAFTWSNNAKQNAGVHVVVVGLSAHPSKKLIFSESGPNLRCQAVSNIGPYLTEGPNLVVKKNRIPPVGTLGMLFGNKVTDGGNLILSPVEKEALIQRDPRTAKWLRRNVGADEFISGNERWCLWLEGISSDELASMPLVVERVERVRAMRLKSAAATTRERLSRTPHLFAQTVNQGKDNYILVPRVSSERREYVPIGFLPSNVIAADTVLIIPGGSIYEFGILNSVMHNDWMRTVTGRLESRYRYSSTLVYNTFPWPKPTGAQRKQVEALAENILLVREDYPGKSLAFLYDPETMPPPLKKAHVQLDETIDRIYRRSGFRDAADRLEHLFARYAQMAGETIQSGTATIAA